MKFFVLVLVLVAGREVGAAEIPLERLKPLQVITELPHSALETLKYSFQRDSVPVWFGLIVSTGLLYQYDADIYDSAMAQGRRWNIGNEDKTKTIISAGPSAPLLRLPSDAGSIMYFLGDGWTHFGIAGAFAATGYFRAEAPRAWNTGLEIVHGIFLSTFFNQALKRSTGRESPNHRTTDKRGVWRPFPNQIAYGKNTPRYDAFPSGHVMTATVTFTVIRNEYPEYAPYIWPVQVLWTSALMFQMMNNGVHWASDYPLAIAMGWVMGKMSARLSHPPTHEPTAAEREKSEREWSFLPTFSEAGDPLIGAYRRF